MGNNTEKSGEFLDKVKVGAAKFFKGVKNFFVKTGRVNSSNYYGCIDGIGDLIVYDDRALISAVGMDDVVFKRENVVSYSFDGLGKPRRNKVTVKYKITLDDNVVFPEKVQEKNDVRNLTATVLIEKDRLYLWGNGKLEYGKRSQGLPLVNACDVYGYSDCVILVLKLERQNGDKVEKYEESLLYPFSKVESTVEETVSASSLSLTVKFADGNTLKIKGLSNDKCTEIKSLLPKE